MQYTEDHNDFSSLHRLKGVETIYADGEDDLSVLEKNHKKGMRYFWGFVAVCVLFIAAGLSWVGFVAFNPSKSFQKENVSLEIEGPTHAASGEELTYVFHYKNSDKNPVQNGSLYLEFPDGFQYGSSQPEPTSDLHNRWNVGTILSGQTGEVTVKGFLFGKKDDDKELKATLTYKPININSELASTQGISTTIDSSVLSLHIVGPNQVPEGGNVSYEIHYSDFSALPNKEKVSVKLMYPEGFAFLSAEPAATFGQDMWGSDTLLKGVDASSKEGVIHVNGIIRGVEGERAFVAQMGYLDNNNFTADQEERSPIQVMKGDLSLQLKVNDATSDGSVQAGGRVQFDLNYENKGTTDLRDVSLVLKTSPTILDWSQVENPTGGLYSSGEVRWTSQQTPALTDLSPGAKGSFRVSLPVKSGADLAQLLHDGVLKGGESIDSYIQASYIGSHDDVNEKMDVQSGTINTVLAANLTFGARARYFNDDGSALGSGPLPPQVGKETRYVIDFSLTNASHSFANTTVSAVLPKGVSWVGSAGASKGEVQYNATTRMVSWSPQSIAQDSEGETAHFTVSILPSPDLSGKSAPLLSGIALSAKDSELGSIMTQAKDPLTTQLDFDPQGKGKGIIQ